MYQVSLEQLKEVVDQLTLLATTFQTKPYYLRPKQIRQSDKSLNFLSTFFSAELAQEATQWKKAADGLKVLRQRMAAVEDKREEIADIDARIAEVQASIKSWLDMDEQERQKILQNSKRAKEFVANNLEKVEAHILHRYKRFSVLKDLSPYSDKVNYLCEAMLYNENREKYELNIKRVTEKNTTATANIKTINRGFWLALMFCAFVVTIPICLPFAISLWRRKKDLKNQITNGTEILRRENNRLKAAAEGAVVEQEIRSYVGAIPLEQIRDTLLEVRDLRAEFQGPEKTASTTAILLNYMDIHRLKLCELFGEMPTDFVESFHWLSENVDRYLCVEENIAMLESSKQEVIAKQKQISKGYTVEVLQNSMQKLSDITNKTMWFPFEPDNKKHFSEICVEIPQIIEQMREVLFLANQNQHVDAQYWDYFRVKCQSFANIMSLCLLNAECDLPSVAPQERVENLPEEVHSEAIS